MTRLPLGAAAAVVLSFSSALAQDLATAPLWTPVAAPGALALVRDARERAARPQIVGSTFVRIDRLALLRFARGQAVRPTFALPLGGGRSLGLVLDDVERTWRHTLFRGHVEGAGHFLMAMGEDGTAAAAIEAGDRVWSIEHAGVSGDVHVLYELDHGRMPLHMSCGVDHGHEVSAPGQPGPGSGVDDPNGPTVIDVAVFYTPASRASAGSAAAMEAQIALRVAMGSDGSALSGVDHMLRLVHAAETTYTETGTSTDLARFRSTNDGYMDEVHAQRDTYGADLMALVIDRSSAFCGVGYLMTRLSTGFRTAAFCVTVRGCLSGHTLTHELGHNMGSHHDRANAGSALFSYSYGYRTPDNAYRTIMSYSPGSRVNRWSSPNVVVQGYTMGTATEDNARSLNGSKATIAAFKPTTTYLWCGHGGGIAGFMGRPQLAGAGTTNGAAPVEVTISNVFPGTAGALAIGVGGQNLPLFGGTLVPFVVDAVPVTAAIPAVTFGANAVRTLPRGAEVFFQAWFVDAAAPQGVSASDAMSVIVP